MRVSDSALLGMRLSVEQGYKRGELSRQHFKCIDDSDPSYFDEVYVKIFEKHLTKKQINQAVKFYKSDAGLKYTTIGFIQIREAILKEKRDYPSFSEAELKTMGDFASSSAGQVLIKDQLLMKDEVKLLIEPYIKRLYEDCKP